MSISGTTAGKSRIMWVGLALVGVVIVAAGVTAWILLPRLFCEPGPLGDIWAEDTEFYNGTVAENKVTFEVDNFNGPIRVSTWVSAEYKINVEFKARGPSHEEAEDYLDDLKVNFDEDVVEGRKRLILNYDVPYCTHSRYTIEVDAVLPADVMIDLDLHSSNGGIYLTEIEGETLRTETSNGQLVFHHVHAETVNIETSNGDIYLTDVEVDTLKMETSNGELVFENVYAETLTGTTSNGRIRGRVEAKDTVLSTSNSRIELRIPCTVSGKYDLTTSNGDIELTVSSSTNVGYDLDLSTSNGDIDVNLQDLIYSQDEKTSKKAKSEDFGGKSVQITIEASTSNGNVIIDTP